MKNTAIVLSAGKGKRMHSNISKQYMLIDNKPLLYYTLMAFEASIVDNIVVVCGSEDKDYIDSEIVKKYGIKKVTSIVFGGKERYDSVYNGLQAIDYSENILMHDGARPLIRSNQINELISFMDNYNACVAGAPVKDTIKIIDDNGYVDATPDRSKVWQIQTPQVFKYSLIKECYDKMRNADDKSVTDDAMVVELYSNEKVKLINTGYNNIKVTTPEDLDYVKYIMKKTNYMSE